MWPWSLLVPWLEDDLRARSAANPGRSAATEAGGDPYDSPAVAMPLREFLEAPFVRDTLHNGSALQARTGMCSGRQGSDAQALGWVNALLAQKFWCCMSSANLVHRRMCISWVV